jgi:hypothetical protein
MAVPGQRGTRGLLSRSQRPACTPVAVAADFAGHGSGYFLLGIQGSKGGGRSRVYGRVHQKGESVVRVFVCALPSLGTTRTTSARLALRV